MSVSLVKQINVMKSMNLYSGIFKTTCYPKLIIYFINNWCHL